MSNESRWSLIIVIIMILILIVGSIILVTDGKRYNREAKILCEKENGSIKTNGAVGSPRCYLVREGNIYREMEFRRINNGNLIMVEAGE